MSSIMSTHRLWEYLKTGGITTFIAAVMANYNLLPNLGAILTFNIPQIIWFVILAVIFGAVIEYVAAHSN